MDNEEVDESLARLMSIKELNNADVVALLTCTLEYILGSSIIEGIQKEYSGVRARHSILTNWYHALSTHPLYDRQYSAFTAAQCISNHC